MVKVNGRQNAYRQAESIGRILAQHGRDCPLCFRTCYQYACGAGQILRKQIVCTRCRGFGRILNLQATDFLNYAHYITVFRSLVRATDCPT